MDNKIPRIAIIEDDASIRMVLRLALKTALGAETQSAAGGIEGVNLVKSMRPDAVLLDIMLPELSGLEVCRAIRATAAIASTPVVMLTAKGEERDIIAGFEAGADDYVAKPFSTAVLVARLKAVMRRQPVDGGRISIDSLELDTLAHTCRIGERQIALTPSEYGILEMMMGAPNRVWTRGQIIDRVQGEEKAVTERTVDVQLVGLRKKLGGWARHIEAVRGVGYRLSE